MTSKVNSIMLIDDNRFDNLVHERTITRNQSADKILSKRSGDEAMEFLRNIGKDGSTAPDLIFLDINMPGMSGWEFIEEFMQLPPEVKDKIVLVILSTSYNPNDLLKAQSLSVVSDFKVKPLTNEMLDEVINANF